MKVLVLGLGSIAKKHIDVLLQLHPLTQIYALRSSDAAIPHPNVINLFTTDELVEQCFDFAIISNPTNQHFFALSILKDLGIPLFIEKPLFENVGFEKEYLVKQIDGLIPTYVACNLRFLDCLIEVKKLLMNERVNEVNIYCGSYLPDWRSGLDYKQTYSANKDQGGGVHIDLIHELDYLYWIFGKPIKTTNTFLNRSSLNITAFDYANYVWEYPEFAANVVLNYFRRDPKRQFEIVCQNETFLIDLLKNEVYLNDELVFKSTQRISDTYLPQMVFFLNKVLQENDRSNTIKEAYTILELCLGA